MSAPPAHAGSIRVPGLVTQASRALGISVCISPGLCQLRTQGSGTVSFSESGDTAVAPSYRQGSEHRVRGGLPTSCCRSRLHAQQHPRSSSVSIPSAAWAKGACSPGLPQPQAPLLGMPWAQTGGGPGLVLEGPGPGRVVATVEEQGASPPQGPAGVGWGGSSSRSSLSPHVAPSQAPAFPRPQSPHLPN